MAGAAVGLGGQLVGGLDGGLTAGVAADANPAIRSRLPQGELPPTADAFDSPRAVRRVDPGHSLLALHVLTLRASERKVKRTR